MHSVQNLKTLMLVACFDGKAEKLDHENDQDIRPPWCFVAIVQLFFPSKKKKKRKRKRNKTKKKEQKQKQKTNSTTPSYFFLLYSCEMVLWTSNLCGVFLCLCLFSPCSCFFRISGGLPRDKDGIVIITLTTMSPKKMNVKSIKRNCCLRC